MNLYDILACPACKVRVIRQDETLTCTQCHKAYPIVNGVPVLLPDASVPVTQYQDELNIRPSYDPWVHRVVLQSLPARAVILDVGAGNLTLSLPNVIRMDVTLTPYVDVVGDAHAMPFLPDTFDFIFSLAVFEHLRQPFIAAQELYAALKNGGYIYHECNFVFAYHGYPHHYFGTTQQGIEQIFASYEKLRSGVAPYQMPSFAIRMLLVSYLRDMSVSDDEEVQTYRAMLQNILDQPLGAYDRFFTEEAALRTAAGVFFFGRKVADGATTVIPQAIQDIWHQDATLQQRLPNLFDLGTASNVLVWAKEARGDSRVNSFYATLVPFEKAPPTNRAEIAAFHALPVIEPMFGFIADTQQQPALAQNEAHLQAEVAMLKTVLQQKNEHILTIENLVQRLESGRVMRLLRLFARG